jgi:glycosyltransferase involved in cell wall biosynthesis
MDVSVVLPTYNRAASLQTTLETFSGLAVPSGITWELLVVDNNSTDGTRAVIEHAARSARFCVRYIFEKRQGRSAALNCGIAAAQGEIVAFTDDDVFLHPEWLAGLIDTFEKFDCAGVAGRIVPLWNHPKPRWLEMEGQQAIVNFELGDASKEIRFAPMGANSAFRKQVFIQHGLFRLDLGVSGSQHTITCDDTEFGERLIRGGEKIMYSPKAIIYHPVDPKRATKEYFLTWYYNNGRSLTRTAGLPNEGVFYFGVPRWLYRELLSNAARWLFCLDGTRRFRYRLATYRSIGNIVESHQLSRLKARNQPISTGGNDGQTGGFLRRNGDSRVGRQVPGGETPAA